MSSSEFFLSAGNALDLMKRGILCSSSAQLASQLVPTISHINSD